MENTGKTGCFGALIIVIILGLIISVFITNRDENVQMYGYMQEDFTFDNMTFNVYDASFRRSIPSTLGVDIETDYYFVYIKIRITNNDKETRNLYSSNFELQSPNESIYEPKTYRYMVNRLDDVELAPGFSGQYNLAFEVPEILEGDYNLKIDFIFESDDPYIILDKIE